MSFVVLDVIRGSRSWFLVLTGMGAVHFELSIYLPGDVEYERMLSISLCIILQEYSVQSIREYCTSFG